MVSLKLFKKRPKAQQVSGNNVEEYRLNYQNVRGLNTKIRTFYQNSLCSDYDIIALSETWLSSGVSSSELFSTNTFNVFRQDRTSGRGGGVLLAVSHRFIAQALPIHCLFNIDVLCVKLNLNNVNLIVIVIYIPPQTTLFNYICFFEYLETLDIINGNVIILGDFNISELLNHYVDNFVNVKLNAFNSFLNLCNLTQQNRILNCNNNILDLVLHSETIDCSVDRENEPLVYEDKYHPSLNICLKIRHCAFNNFNYSGRSRYNFKHADFNILYNLICNTNWDCLKDYTDVNDMCNAFYGELYQIINETVPKKTITFSKYPRWFNKNIIRNIKIKNHYLRMNKRISSNFYRLKIKHVRKLIKQEISTAYDIFLNNAEESLRKNPKLFWSHINDKLSKTRIPGTVSFNNISYSSPQGIVDAFAAYFASVYDDRPNIAVPSTCYNFNCNTNLYMKAISEYDVIQACKRLKANFTMGLDNIPAFLVTDCISALVQPLLIIFNCIIQYNVFPDCWKLARVTPVFKKGISTDVKNYRPISIISNFAKIFEIIIAKCIFNHVEKNITPYQHGFFSGRSTVSNLCLFTHYVSEVLADRKQVDVIYTDFSKAFDMVPHSLILRKLDRFGLSNNIIQLLGSYLFNRMNVVEHGGYISEPFHSPSGVPQGTNLGPLLFIMFIDDIVYVIKSNVLLYADDLKLFKKIVTYEDCKCLQDDLDALSVWCYNNGLSFNIQKCKHLSFCRNFSRIDFNYNICGIPLVNVNTFKDLGVIFDVKLSFIAHINAICEKACKMLGFVIRNSRDFRNIDAIKSLYFAYVRSVLEYGSVVWSPIYSVHIDRLESIQRKFLKFLYFKTHGFYPPRGYDQNALQLEFFTQSLQMRRVIAQCVFLFRTVNSIISCNDLLCLINFHVPRLNSRLLRTFNYNSINYFNSPIMNMCRQFDLINVDGTIDIFAISINAFFKQLRTLIE